jgi:predicted unusual protein kinase regulating ubiquinone biosynthesis (AarF/ABC1/UbiB family)
VSNRSSTDEDDEVADTEDGEGMEECAPMTWDEKECARKAASLPLIELGIRCTLSQLIETGVMHADPHGGNLLRLRETGELAYLDFGLVSEIPPTVRDGLVAAVTLLVFDRDYEAVAGLFGELMLVPTDVIENPYQFAALTEALREAAQATLSYPDDALGLERGENETEEEARLRRAKSAVPDVRFDQLLGALLALVPKYRFLLPPYFLNNARALGTLEGMARTADPNFNILAIVYPFAVKRLLQNPTGSPVLRRVLRQLISNKRTGRMSLTRLKLMVEDAAALTGVSRFAIMRSAMQTSAGWRLAVESVFAGAFWCASQVVGAVFFVTGVTWMRNAWGRFIYRLNRDIDEDDMTPSRVGSVF